MVQCNTERVKGADTGDDIISNLDYHDCEQVISDADMMDFRTKMDNLSFYEKTEWNACEDLIYVKNEECLWQTIVGEIKTPLGALSNSIGQTNYGCNIWSYLGEKIDSLDILEIEHDVINVCLKYAEVNNVIGIETYIADREVLLIEITLDTIYGTFDGRTRIPLAYVSNRDWRKV